MQVEDDNVSDEDLHIVPRRFAILSQKLAAKFQSISHGNGNISKQICLEVEKLLKKGEPPPGLLLLRVIIKYYATNRACEFLYNINDLAQARVRDGNLEGFISTWNLVLQGMREKPSESQLEYMFYDAIKDHKDVKEDIAHYDRLEEGSGGDRSYQFLRDSVNRALRIQRMRGNRKAQSQALGGVLYPWEHEVRNS